MVATPLWSPAQGTVNEIDGIPVGKQTPSSGSFTTLAASGATSVGSLALHAAGVTASTTHSLAGATPLNPISIVTCANASDAVKLPVATAGLIYIVITVSAAATPAVWPGQAGDQIDAVTAGSSTTLTAAHRGAWFICDTAGHWTSTLFGAVAT